jgi:phosphatidylglycerophosphate synthase
MLDNRVRSIIDPALNAIARNLARAGVSADGVTWTGFLLGLTAAFAIAQGWFLTGAAVLLLSRLCDGLDGAVARESTSGGSDLGGFLDIVLDFAFYGAIPFAFILTDPATNAVAGGALLLTFYVNGASFLTFALMAEKRGIDPDARGSKALLYTAGLAEGTETIAVFLAMCLFPAWFVPLAWAFAAITVVTTATRFVLAYRTFKD